MRHELQQEGCGSGGGALTFSLLKRRGSLGFGGAVPSTMMSSGKAVTGAGTERPRFLGDF